MHHTDAVSLSNHPDLGLEFKPSPFYTVEQQLGETKTCEGEKRITMVVVAAAD